MKEKNGCFLLSFFDIEINKNHCVTSFKLCVDSLDRLHEMIQSLEVQDVLEVRTSKRCSLGDSATMCRYRR